MKDTSLEMERSIARCRVFLSEHELEAPPVSGSQRVSVGSVGSRYSARISSPVPDPAPTR